MVPCCTIRCNGSCGSVVFSGTTTTVTYEETVQDIFVFDWISVVSTAQKPVEDTVSCILLTAIIIIIIIIYCNFATNIVFKCNVELLVGRLLVTLTLGVKCYLFLVVCGYMIGQVYALITTLITPIMSDQFGFNVEYTSYFLTGAGVAFSSASILQ